jgi:hypothetical protein
MRSAEEVRDGVPDAEVDQGGTGCPPERLQERRRRLCRWPRWPLLRSLLGPAYRHRRFYKAIKAQDFDAIKRVGDEHDDFRLAAYSLAGLSLSTDQSESRRLLEHAFATGEDPAEDKFVSTYLYSRIELPLWDEGDRHGSRPPPRWVCPCQRPERTPCWRRRSPSGSSSRARPITTRHRFGRRYGQRRARRPQRILRAPRSSRCAAGSRERAAWMPPSRLTPSHRRYGIATVL